MSVPTYGSSRSTPFLTQVLDAGFSSYFSGSRDSFYALLGLSIYYHSMDSAIPWPDHLIKWQSTLESVVAAGRGIAQRPSDRNNWQRLHESVKYFLSHSISLPIPESSPPDFSDSAFIEALTATLGIAIVWFEWEIYESTTTAMYAAQENSWVFYVYMGRDRDNVYSFRPQADVDHYNEVFCGQYRGHLPPPIVVGGRKGITNPDALAKELWGRVLSAVADVRPRYLSEISRNEIYEFSRVFATQVESVPSDFPFTLEVQKELTRLSEDRDPEHFSDSSTTETSEIDTTIATTHKLEQCFKFPEYPSKYITHNNSHKFHESCLRKFILEKQAGDKNKMIACPKCPNIFSEPLILSLFPKSESVKKEAVMKEISKSNAHSST